MLDHITLSVSDITRSKSFYDAALAPLGIQCLYAEGETFAGYGANDIAFFWLGQKPGPHTSVHIAFTAPDRATVQAFRHAALSAGADDNGTPGLRPYYHEDYYGAFVLDPDGHNIEAVCHKNTAQLTDEARAALRGSVIHYEAPFDPVGLEDWHALKD